MKKLFTLLVVVFAFSGSFAQAQQWQKSFSNTEFKTLFGVEKEHQMYVLNPALVKNKTYTVNADGTKTLKNGNMPATVNVMSRRFSENRSVIRALGYVGKTKDWRVVGPQYYQNMVLKNWKKTAPVYSKEIIKH